MSGNEEITGIIVIIAIVVVMVLGYNFLGSIKTAPISLVPAGTQAAVNPASQQALDASIQGGAYGSALALTAAQQQQQDSYNLAMQNAQGNTYAGIGAGIGSIISGFTGSPNNYYGN